MPCAASNADLQAQGHLLISDIDDSSPADKSNIVAALKQTSDLVLYFGHGTEDSWLTNAKATADSSNISSASGKSVVSVACKTGRQLGPDAVTAGSTAWLAFTIKVPVISVYKTKDPLGEAIVDALAGLGRAKSVGDVRDDLVSNLDALVTEYDSGRYSCHPQATMAYFAVMALRDHVVALGKNRHVPL